MTEEQLNDLKFLINARLDHCKETLQQYKGKGETFDFMKHKMEGKVDAYESVLGDIEKIMNK